MWNGFYSLKKLNDSQLLEFFERALELSYHYRIDIKDDSYSRTACTTLTLEHMKSIISSKNHNVCIDRTIQHSGNYHIDEGEVGFSTLSEKYDKFLYVFMTQENVTQLAKEFKLKQL